MQNIAFLFFIGVLAVTGFLAAQEDAVSASSAATNAVENESKPPDGSSEASAKKIDSSAADNKNSEKDTPKSPHTFGGYVTFISDYRFRGVSQTMCGPAVQAEFDYSYKNGLYLSLFGSNISGLIYNNANVELDFYAGYKGKALACALPDLKYNVGIVYYYYYRGEAAIPSRNRFNTAEIYFEISYKWFALKFWETVTDYFGVNSQQPAYNYHTGAYVHANGTSRGSFYIETNWNFDLSKKYKVSLLMHGGCQTVRNYHQLSTLDWLLTLNKSFDWFDFSVSYVGSNANPDYFDVPDQAYHPKKHAVGAQACVIGVTKLF